MGIRYNGATWTSVSSLCPLEPSHHYNPSGICRGAGGCVRRGSCEDAIGGYEAIVMNYFIIITHTIAPITIFPIPSEAY